MRKKRIGLLNFNLTISGGIARVASLMAAQLADRYDIHLISMTGSGGFPFDLPSGVSFTILMPENSRIRATIIKGSGLLRSYQLENQLDALLVLGDWCGISALKALRKSGLPLVICDHGTLSSPTLSRYTKIETWLEYRRFARVVVLTEKARNILVKKCPSAAGKTVCIPNCIELPASLAPFPAGVPELVTLTRLSEDKGLNYLLGAARALKERIGDFVWRVYGDGDRREWLKGEIEKYRLSDNLILMGSTNDPASAYNAAVAAVLTTSHEGLPMALLEAKALGRSLVAFDIPCGPSDLIRDGADGFLIPFGDFDKMAERLAQILSDNSLAKRLAQNAHGNIEPYLPENVRNRWIELIDSII